MLTGHIYTTLVLYLLWIYEEFYFYGYNIEINEYLIYSYDKKRCV